MPVKNAFQNTTCLFLMLVGLLISSNISAATLLGSWSFDESDWDVTGSVADNLGAHNGVLNGTVGRNASAAATSHAGTCAAANFGGGAIEVTGLGVTASSSSDYSALKSADSSYVEKTSVSFWMFWDGSNSVMPIGFNRHDLWLYGGSFGFNSGNGDIYGISSAGLANGWHHVVAEFTNYEMTNNKLYIDGALQSLSQRRSSPNNSRSVVDPHLRIGGWWANNGYRFSGLLDEVKIYDGALSAAEVNADFTYTHAGVCPPDPVPDPPVLIASYDFNDNWSSSQDLEDSVGTADGVVSGSLSRINAPASGLKPDTCYSGDFSGGAIDINSLPVSTAPGKQTSISFWMRWDGTNSVMPLGWRLHDLWFYGGSFGFNSAAGDIYGISSAGLAGDWHHVTAIFTNNNAINNKLYIDGVLQTLTQRRGNIRNSNAVVDPHLRLGGWWANNGYRFRGELDELRIFIGTVDQATVDDIRNESCTTLLGKWSMDEPGWTDSTNEAIDSSGNGYHGTPSNGATTSSINPVISGSPGTCNYGHFDDAGGTTGDYIALPGFPSLNENFTVTAWINANNNSARGQRIFADDENNSGGFALSLGDGGTGRLRFYSRNINPIILDGGSGTIQNNTWYFVAAVANISDSTRTIYVFNDSGTLIETTSGSFSGTWGSDTGIASIGGETNNGETSNRFSGAIDEVQVYSGAMSQAAIATLLSETHSCPSSPTLDHFEIIHDGNGLTCDPESVTINACINSDCSSLSTSAVTLDLQGDGTTLTSTTFTGSTTVNFNHITAETLTLSVANPSIAPSNALVCSDGFGTSCDITFATAGFRFLYGAAESTTIDNQVAGSNFSETLQLQAVEDTNGVCSALFTGSVDLELSQQNVAPAGTTGLSFTINGGTNIAKYSGYTPGISLNFGSDSKATITSPNYLDAGQIRLHARYDVAGVSLVGSSNSFWVSPAKLVVTATSAGNNLNASTASGSPTHKAGANFDLQTRAVNTAGTTTQNYQPGQVQFKLARTGPTSGGVEGNLNYASSASIASALVSAPASFQNATLENFTLGVSTYSAASYSEVGLLNLDLQDSNYGGAGILVPGDDINIGRFIPDHFDVSVSHGALQPYCAPAAANDFSYIGQPITYASPPSLSISARNASNSVTQNYTETGYLKLAPTDINRVFPNEDRTQLGEDGSALMAISSSVTQPSGFASAASGLLSYVFATSDSYTYVKDSNALVAPFPNNFNIVAVNFSDSDSVSSNAAPYTLTPSGLELRFGRWAMDNAYGPETNNLSIPMRIEQWDGSRFATNIDENCSAYSATNLQHVDNLGSGSTSPSGMSTLVNGEAALANQIQLSAPGVGNDGTSALQYQGDSWLRFDWDDDTSTADTDATTTATFGQYRGHDRIIYWREVQN